MARQPESSVSPTDFALNGNVTNYSGRVGSFSSWATSDADNLAGSAAARRLFITALQSSFPDIPSTSLRVLDAGCGPGRDLQAFRQSNFQAEGLDPVRGFCEAAATASGCATYVGDFLALPRIVASLQPAQTAPRALARYHGVFALASLFHVPVAVLPAAIGAIVRCFHPGGVLLSSFPLPRGGGAAPQAGAEAWARGGGVEEACGGDGRWHTCLSHDAHCRLLATCGMRPLEAATVRLYNGSFHCVVSRLHEST
eukprot:TRINITY_DN13319_c0_g1_i1.p1 TRINITY_DN13319_c0_g1~~TRINITY_DN13319_c0_g1_i1.p1  ORF type:complete len:277 (-),score=9.70 TRINITY_DN13319_c0_g1_i1:351-1115(-)